MPACCRMDNQGDLYGYGGQGSCPDSEQWEFPLSANLDELENDNISQAHLPFQAAMSQGGRDYVPEMQLHSNINELVSEMPSTKPKKGGKGKKVSQRGKAFSKEEDRVICSAFLNVSKDPITGTNQSSGGYYQRMHDYFTENIDAPTSRSVMAVHHRWLSIQKAIDEAVKMFEDSEPWTFMHCWAILKNEAKWSDKMVELNTNGELARPEGRDTAKKKRARPTVDTSVSSTTIEVLQSMNERGQIKNDKEDSQMAQILQRKDAKIELQQNMIALQREEMEKRWEIEKEKLSLTREEVEMRKEQTKVELLKAEAHFMGQDLDKLASHLKEYYISIQREIMDRHGIRGPTPPSS
ncbi:hypothetical protein U9M48_005467 [Paspalum notatum var. saurae]|uniref:No apical meristem-associated C-terminal domain-containing protein n=1 Tax=Paspalum notatum var. saurae TaxID=547442 RepID=A0AAQ3PXS3_PASNO